MSAHDQCPSTAKGHSAGNGRRDPAAHRRPAALLHGAAGGPRVWRSPDELADTPEFREFVEREFPAGASELLTDSRRDFLKLMGASLALAGAATIPGCRRPEGKILPYSREVPEDTIPGKPLYYATSLPLPGGGAEGLVVETHEGRPIKVEGNPLHPVNQGRSSAWAQASVLDVYDPDRLGDPGDAGRPEDRYPQFKNPARGYLPATWDDFASWASTHFPAFDADQGGGLAFLVDRQTGPSRDAARRRILERWPRAMWASYDPIEPAGPRAGTAIAFASPMRELYRFDLARVVLSLDRDFLNAASGVEPGALAHARGFAANRRPESADDEISRLYVAESGFSITGGSADHRLRLPPSKITVLACELARELLRLASSAPHRAIEAAIGSLRPTPLAAESDPVWSWLKAVAEDLHAHRGSSLIVAGPSQPAEVHALAHALNGLLGNIGSTVRYLPMGDDEGRASAPALASLTRAMASGSIRTLVVVNANPMLSAPGELDFAAAWARVGTTITLSVGQSETIDASTWRLNGAHPLESWGDTEAVDGTLAPVQPLIAPLFGGRSDLELLALVAGAGRAGHDGADHDADHPAHPDGLALVREAWRAVLGGPDDSSFERTWRRALHDGLIAGSTKAGQAPAPDLEAVGAALRGLVFAPAPTETSLELVSLPGRMHDGRFANNGWLQELPQAGTYVVWDNPALISPSTARALGLMPDDYTEQYPDGRLARLTVGGRSVEMPVWILPGMADGTVIVQPGYGRRVCGRVGTGVGVDVSALLAGDGSRVRSGATLEKLPGEFPIASTQNHWTMEGRTSIARQLDAPVWRRLAAAWAHHRDGLQDDTDRLYGTTKRLNVAEQLGELSHTPANIGLYVNPFNASRADADKAWRNPATDRPAPFAQGPQWGMTIDLSACTGCGVCTVACQAENNIPIVGKKEVSKGREMAWIRVDRYFVGDDLDDPSVIHQPVPCVHCENAPCETVCPVNATVHGPEGINYMVYNRCIGTRYCANNCPYKVRRFNFFDYGVAKFNGDYYGQSLMPGGGPDNKNLIPPRLRDKLDQISRLQKNPNVTVRSRGVMEKCSYCIQRINAARVECKLHDMTDAHGRTAIPDGFFQTACQQACPSGAITFGDIFDPATRVSKLRNGQRSYALLGYLNTRPRTTHLLAIRNPNPAIREAFDPTAGHGAGHGGGAGHDDHGGDHGADGGSAEHGRAGKGGGDLAAFFRDPAGTRRDRGYALSLSVLSAGGMA